MLCGETKLGHFILMHFRVIHFAAFSPGQPTVHLSFSFAIISEPVKNERCPHAGVEMKIESRGIIMLWRA